MNGRESIHVHSLALLAVLFSILSGYSYKKRDFRVLANVSKSGHAVRVERISTSMFFNATKS